MSAIVHLTRDEIADFPVAEVTIGGKTVQAGEPLEAARRALASSAVKVLPVLDGERYFGALDRRTLEEVPGDAPLATLAQPLVPLAGASTRARDALSALDHHGATRLVVVGEGDRYVGIVCLRGDRTRLCIDADRLGILT